MKTRKFILLFMHIGCAAGLGYLSYINWAQNHTVVKVVGLLGIVCFLANAAIDIIDIRGTKD